MNHARIALAHSDGSFVSVYLHDDENEIKNSLILSEFYRKETKVCSLMKLGDLSRLGKKIRPSKGFEHTMFNPENGVCIFYSRDRGDTGTDAVYSPTLASLKKLCRNTGAYHLYIYDSSYTFLWKEVNV